MTGRELIAALQALPAKTLDAPIHVYEAASCSWRDPEVEVDGVDDFEPVIWL
ncbi:hypothetical protein PBI_HUFFY_77 [Gordonia phage Huffy]|uniref:Uncharacterized protein n=1 Tax=Gordonia phage TZGordon TaxID=2744004 RepID=A0A6N0A5B9_9CAUD|nr:hypothetical protein KDJ61_gp38 [Gordonia phage TZGordon]AQY55678.1 hypothetical protein PBI_HUFFY_77 [Gordonia phage Huffy]AQY55761.1 hypothetical protein PBI_DINODARYN_77 [Gordonia phage DinoDaryn]QKO02996.1 hypothetical protein SEA_TZGORDON_78 [Gordonia phage TZGordon]